ncbi:MAG: sodium-translocating pyrophosphatase, partial [Proteobacteria bacterium]
MLRIFKYLATAIIPFVFVSQAFASEVELHIPPLDTVSFNLFGQAVSGHGILIFGIVVCVLGMLFGLYEFNKVKSLPAHKSMLDVSSLIYETCKTYLLQQGKFLILLEVLIGICISYYFYFLLGLEASKVATILLWSVLGILGSFS